jgi:hypothetical protein
MSATVRTRLMVVAADPARRAALTALCTTAGFDGSGAATLADGPPDDGLGL